MAYIGKDLNNLGDVQTLDNITFNAGAGPYNLQNGGVQVINADTASIMISIDGVVQGGNYTVNGSAGTITFDFSVSSGSVCNFVKLFGTGVQLTPKDNSVTTIKVANDAITDAKIDTVAASKLTGALPAISGASLTNLPSETKPTVDSVAPSTITNAAQNIVITGTNFVAIPRVDVINTATGIWYSVNTVTRDSATQLTVNLALAVDANTYRIRVENPDGNAGLSAANFLTTSDAPVWTTSAGTLGTVAGDFSGTVTTVAATGDTVTFTEVTSVLTNASLANCAISSAGAITTSDFDGSGTTARTHTFTLRATDAQSQTTDREFTLTSSYGATGGGQFN